MLELTWERNRCENLPLALTAHHANVKSPGVVLASVWERNHCKNLHWSWLLTIWVSTCHCVSIHAEWGQCKTYNSHEKEAVRMPVVTLAVCRKICHSCYVKSHEQCVDYQALNEIPIMNRCLISLIRGLCGENADESLRECLSFTWEYHVSIYAGSR